MAALDETSKLAEIVNDPRELSAFQRVMSRMATRTNEAMSPEAKTARAKKGAAARNKNLSVEQKKEIARKAGKKGAEARWGPPKTDD